MRWQRESTVGSTSVGSVAVRKIDPRGGFEEFEHRVGGLRRHSIRVGNERDPVVALSGAETEGPLDFAELIDLEHVVLVFGQDFGEVDPRPWSARWQLAHSPQGASSSAAAAAGAAIKRSSPGLPPAETHARAQDALSEIVSDRALADAARPGDQQDRRDARNSSATRARRWSAPRHDGEAPAPGREECGELFQRVLLPRCFLSMQLTTISASCSGVPREE